MSDQLPEELPSSKLGTKEFWDSAYELEIKNFNDHGDCGEVWFGEDSAYRIIRWLTENEAVSQSDSIIDLGCGNGMMLIELSEEGFTNLTGVDYSAQAIELAKKIAEDKGRDNIKYATCDIVSDTMELRSYDVVLDKGTYDAICLNPDNAPSHRQAYKRNLKLLLKPAGLFVIASCNWTEEELKHQFEGGGFSITREIQVFKDFT